MGRGPAPLPPNPRTLLMERNASFGGSKGPAPPPPPPPLPPPSASDDIMLLKGTTFARLDKIRTELKVFFLFSFPCLYFCSLFRFFFLLSFFSCRKSKGVVVLFVGQFWLIKQVYFFVFPPFCDFGLYLFHFLGVVSALLSSFEKLKAFWETRQTEMNK